LFIDRLDEENTAKQQIRALREENKRQPSTSGFKISAEKQLVQSSEEGTSFESCSSSSDFVVPPSRQSTGKQTRLPLPKLSLATFRTGVTPRQAALIATAALDDAKLFAGESTEYIIDETKIRRQKKKKKQLRNTTRRRRFRSQRERSLF